MSLTVGELAGLAVRALHHYHDLGLLVPRTRSAAGYRLYSDSDSDSDVRRLYRIQSLRRLGTPLAGIADALNKRGHTVTQLVDRQLADLETRIAQAEQLHTHLLRLRSRMRTGKEPTFEDPLRALEQLALYEAHCSPEELKRLLAHDNDAAWPPFIADVRAAMAAGTAPTSRAAHDGFDAAMLEHLGPSCTSCTPPRGANASVRAPRIACAFRATGRANGATSSPRRVPGKPDNEGAPLKAQRARFAALMRDLTAHDAALAVNVVHALREDPALQALCSLDAQALRRLARISPPTPSSRSKRTAA